MNLEDYLESLKTEYSRRINELCKALGDMPYETFRYKVRNRSFDLLEQEKIAEVLQSKREKLFPFHESDKVA